MRRYLSPGIAQLAGVLLVLGAVGAAQTPATPADAALTGVVRDASGSPVDGVDVALVGETRSVRTDSTGRFALRSLGAGGHTALFRRLGYQSVEYRWVARAGQELQITVSMKRAIPRLNPVVAEAAGTARRRGSSSIAGTVVADGRPIAGADVRLLGAGLSTVTDSSGRFAFELLAAGPYMVRARHAGLAGRTVIVQLADSDGRGLTVSMSPLPARPNTRPSAMASGYGAADESFDEFDRRIRTNPGEPLIGPADLFRADGASLDFLVQRYRAGASIDDDDACVLIDGRRAFYEPLHTFITTGVQLVEVVLPHDVDDGFVKLRMASLRECAEHDGRHPVYFVVWTRSVH
jgi:hypothetical protein